MATAAARECREEHIDARAVRPDRTGLKAPTSLMSPASWLQKAAASARFLRALVGSG